MHPTECSLFVVAMDEVDGELLQSYIGKSLGISHDDGITWLAVAQV